MAYNKLFYISFVIILNLFFSSFATDVDFTDHDQIRCKLLKSPIKKEIKEITGHRSQIYIVKLEDETLAIFKERDYENFSGLFSEVMAYKFSHDVLGLEHTVLPTVPKFYNTRGLYGTLQPFINSTLNLSDHLDECIKNANHESYDNLQIFLFCASMSDLNMDGIIPWYKGGQINFTYVDSEMAFSVKQSYGGCSPELRNTLYNYTEPKYVFTSKFTSSFPSETIQKLKLVNDEILENLWKSTLLEINSSVGINPKISPEDKEIYLKFIMKDIHSILDAAASVK